MVNFDNLNVGDPVSFTSKKFNYNDSDKIWFVIEKTINYIRLEEDDSSLIELSPPRGKHIVMIPSKHWGEVNIKIKIKIKVMEEILKEFGEVGAPSMGEITTLVYESKYGSDEE